MLRDDLSVGQLENDMALKEVLDSLHRWSGAASCAGLATLVRVRRSAPRRPGARFAANDRGDVAGSVSSGCVEGDLYEHIQQVLKSGEPRLVEYGITDEMAVEVGLACGGDIEVLIAPFDPESEVWGALERVISEAAAAALLTGLSDAIRARQLLFLSDGSHIGSLGDETLDGRAEEMARPLLDTGGAQIIELDDPSASIFCEAFLPPGWGPRWLPPAI